MTRCRVLTTSGKQCKNDASSHLPLCHIHDPNGEWMRQRPSVRAAWLKRPDIAAIMAGTAVNSNHCRSCTCVRAPKPEELAAAANSMDLANTV
jgi:hypothetical protein